MTAPMTVTVPVHTSVAAAADAAAPEDDARTMRLEHHPPAAGAWAGRGHPSRPPGRSALALRGAPGPPAGPYRREEQSP